MEGGAGATCAPCCVDTQSATSPFVTHESHSHPNQTVCSYEPCVHLSGWSNVLHVPKPRCAWSFHRTNGSSTYRQGWRRRNNLNLGKFSKFYITIMNLLTQMEMEMEMSDVLWPCTQGDYLGKVGARVFKVGGGAILTPALKAPRFQNFKPQKKKNCFQLEPDDDF